MKGRSNVPATDFSPTSTGKGGTIAHGGFFTLIIEFTLRNARASGKERFRPGFAGYEGEEPKRGLRAAVNNRQREGLKRRPVSSIRAQLD